MLSIYVTVENHNQTKSQRMNSWVPIIYWTDCVFLRAMLITVHVTFANSMQWSLAKSNFAHVRGSVVVVGIITVNNSWVGVVRCM